MKKKLYLFLLLSAALTCFAYLNANSKNHLDIAFNFKNFFEYNASYHHKTTHTDTTYFKPALDSITSFLFILENNFEEVENFEKSQSEFKSKFFVLKNNTSFLYQNLAEKKLLITKEEALFKDFISKTSCTRLYKRFQVYLI